MPGKWLSKPAVTWVLDDAPDVPAHLVAALLAVARYADQDGRGAHPSAATVAEVTRKSERQAKRDLAELVQRGLLARGDQRIVAHIRGDKRPAVYDLAMPRGDMHDTPPDGHGVTSMTARGDIQGRHGVSPMTPKEVQKTSGRRARANGADAPRAPAPKPPWCGGCDEHSRMINPDAPQRCPACHPLAEAVTR